MAKTGTEVTSTEIGNRILTMMMSTLLPLEAERTAKISDDPEIL